MRSRHVVGVRQMCSTSRKALSRAPHGESTSESLWRLASSLSCITCLMNVGVSDRERIAEEVAAMKPQPGQRFTRRFRVGDDVRDIRAPPPSTIGVAIHDGTRQDDRGRHRRRRGCRTVRSRYTRAMAVKDQKRESWRD